jgi:hypothetical protein
MAEHETLFSVQWANASGKPTHYFLLFASNSELAYELANQIIGTKGRILSVQEFGPAKRRCATAVGR